MPTSIELLMQEKQQEQRRVLTVIEQLEGALATLRLWVEETDTSRRKKTLVQMAEDVLRIEGKPMHSEKIAERISEKFGRVKKESVSQTLHRCVTRYRETCAFIKSPGNTNTYGLKEWK